MAIAMLVSLAPDSAWAQSPNQNAAPPPRSQEAPQPVADDPDTEVASREFHRGTALYNDGHYEDAILAFEKARAIKPLPAFDYNIARCYDRLGRWADAIKYYERYAAAAKPQDPNGAAQANERIAVLKQRVTPAAGEPGAPPPSTAAPAPPAARAAIVAPAAVETAPAPPAAPHKRRWVWGVVGGVAALVAGAAIGLGVAFGTGSHDPSPTIGVATWGK